jgi:hypothetical protein
MGDELDDDYSFNVHLKRNLIHKSMYLQGCITKATVKQWLEHLIRPPCTNGTTLRENQHL